MEGSVLAAPPTLTLQTGVYSPWTRTLRGPTREIRLSPLEGRLLEFLASHPGQPIQYRTLLREVWGYRDSVDSRTVYSTISRLRMRIEADPSAPRHIRALSGVGYRFDPLEDDELATSAPARTASARAQ
jgi:DNA-binding response OmpR family regulator